MYNRIEVEKFRVEKGIKTLDVFRHADDKVAIGCSLRGGKLYNCYGQVVCSQLEPLWGYIKWDGHGNAERCDFEGTVETPFRRNGKRV